MSANDNFSLHDDEELSLHDDASLDGSAPASNKGDAPTKPPQIITTNTLSNIKLPVLQKDDYDTWCFDNMLDYTVIAIPFVEGSGSYLHTIKVEYEEETTKMRHVRNATTRNDVFQVVQNRKSKDKQHIRSMGFKPKTTFENVGTSRTGNVNNNVQDESKAVLYEEDDYDIYDNYDIKGLSKSNWCFVDIRIRGPHR
ncbi:hypothetical protein Tco_0046990 [Tanacetum coccineum]